MYTYLKGDLDITQSNILDVIPGLTGLHWGDSEIGLHVKHFRVPEDSSFESEMHLFLLCTDTILMTYG